MVIPIKHYGLYRFRNRAYDNNQALNAYGTDSLVDGRNVMLYKYDFSDKAQNWRVMYAGIYGEHTLYWMNCQLGGVENPFALDRFTGALFNNADVYMAKNSSAADQLVYFVDAGIERCVYIHLYGKTENNNNPEDLVLTAAKNPDGVNGNNSPTSLTQAGNVYWAPYEAGNEAQQWIFGAMEEGEDPWTENRATAFPAEKYYQHENDRNYPGYVGECTWYCNGRFVEVNGEVLNMVGNAALWFTGELPSYCDRDTDIREKSVAVFGPRDANDKREAGHVVFVESLGKNEDGEDVVEFSECNVMSSISNGEIEVRNKYLPNAVDGYIQTVKKSDFKNLHNYKFLCVIYKK